MKNLISLSTHHLQGVLAGVAATAVLLGGAWGLTWNSGRDLGQSDVAAMRTAVAQGMVCSEGVSVEDQRLTRLAASIGIVTPEPCSDIPKERRAPAGPVVTGMLLTFVPPTPDYATTTPIPD